jgi:uncharacterized protein (DUF924 family)
MATSNDYLYTKVLDFWFSDENKSKWFLKDKNFDALITEKFLNYYDRAIKGDLDHWMESPKTMLALIIVLDQFPRNMFRNQPESFAADHIALFLSKEAIKKSMDKNLPSEYQRFFYMPLMHSENLDDQKLCVKLFKKNLSTIDYAKMHMNVIKKFGRFPHRNVILSRESTEEEVAFLKSPNSSF